MGFRFRKSVNFGGFRVNISKSGIGYSYGVKGARVTKTASGKTRTTLSVPGTGLSYVTESGAKKSNQTPNIPQSDNNFSAEEQSFESLENLNIKDCSSAKFEDFTKEIKTTLTLNTISTVLICTFVLSATPFFIFTGIAGVLMKIYVRTQKKVQITYEFDASSKSGYDKLYYSWMKLKDNAKVWQTMSSLNNVDKKQNAGASRLITRRPASATNALPWFLESNVTPFGLKLGKRKLLFLPDKVLVVDGLKIGAVDYQSLSIETGVTRFIENETVPKDAEVVGYTWAKVNKNGSPDKRFKNNRQLPECVYGQVCIKSSQGLKAEIMCSDKNTILKFKEAAMKAATLSFVN